MSTRTKRWWACDGCEVTWFGGSATCWLCSSRGRRSNPPDLPNGRGVTAVAR